MLNSLNLSTAAVGGLYQVGTQYGRLVAGYMTPIPTEWQSALGATAITGQSDLAIISTSSSGPAAFGFNPSSLGTGVTAATTYLDYPSSSPLGPYQISDATAQVQADPLQSGTTQVKGAVFVPGSSTVLYYGSTGTNYDGYGLPSTYGDNIYVDAKGPHSLNGQYALQVWAYNAKDFVAVKNGTMQPQQVQPYDVWNITLPIPAIQVGGVAYDSNTGRLYVSVMNVDQEVPYSSLPLIEVFQVKLPSGTGSPVATTPTIGTLAVTPSTLVPGSIAAGTPITLTDW